MKPNDDTDNGAAMAGFTDQYMADCDAGELHLSVKPGTDLDDRFKAFCHDTQEYITLNGWLFSFEPIAD